MGSRNLVENGTVRSCGGDATPLQSNTGFSVGRWVDENGAQYFRGRVGEVFVFEVPLSTAQRDAYTTWMRGRWNGTIP